MNKELEKKYRELRKHVRELGSAIVAFSGGIDSTLVLKVAHDELGSKAVAVTADSPSMPRREMEQTKKIAAQIGAHHIIVQTEETKEKNYLKNPGNRCYYCKSELYQKLGEISKGLGIRHILNGTNLDDISDYRPGLRAADENNVASPLKNAMLSKKDVRELAKILGLEIWDKPSSPCLSSRVPYGHEITMKKLAMIEKAENFLRDFGIAELRVRHFGDLARIEVLEKDRYGIISSLGFIQQKFNEIGFKKIEVANFKSGNLNVMIKMRE